MLSEIRKNLKNYKALFINNPTNVYYLTGFTGSRAFIFITSKKAYFLTDFRYFEYAKNLLSKEFTLIQIDKKWHEDWPKLLKKLRINSIGFEDSFMTVSKLAEFKKISKRVKFIKAGSVIEKIREIKSKKELQNLIKSQQINEEILKRTVKFLKVGRTEKEIETFILKQNLELQTDGPSFNPIVAFGKHSAIPHHQNSNRKLKKGDVVLLDMGAKYKKYCSDMTRVFFTQKPTKKQAHVYQTCLDAQKAAIKAIKPNNYISKVVKAATDIINQEGYKENFKHALGHGVGLDIHELPNLGTKKPEKLLPNMLTTIEPGIYIQNQFGVRIEDIIIVTSTGNKNITKAPKELNEIIIKV